MTKIFMSDDAGIGSAIGTGFSFQSDRSTWAMVKPLKDNLELEVAAVYTGRSSVETVPNSRGVQVHVHYSVRELPKVGSNGYKPREADDRIGYFLTVIKDFSDKAEDEHFVRYINRWNLQKKDDKAELSPPKEPIMFYIEKTAPVALRPTIEAGILEWNKAFEKIGFANAIRVQNEEDLEAQVNLDIDPEDVRYNFFRWITADAGFAMGPSRVNPRTGQILDADIIFDARFLNYWKQDYELFTDEDAARLHPNWTPLDEAAHGGMVPTSRHLHTAACRFGHQMQQQMGFAAALMTARGDLAADGKLPKEFIHQGLKEVVMHEVGHTLGLRHNFKASTWKSLNEIREKGASPTEPIVASVMDYSPANIAATKETQGLYYSQTLGPYDVWAIEYGYKPFASDETKELAAIAARSGEPGLDYATDEDTRSSDSDPLSNRFDLGNRADRIRAAADGPLHATPVQGHRQVGAGGTGLPEGATGVWHVAQRILADGDLCLSVSRRRVRQPGPQGGQGRRPTVPSGGSREAARRDGAAGGERVRLAEVRWPAAQLPGRLTLEPLGTARLRPTRLSDPRDDAADAAANPGAGAEQQHAQSVA